MAMKTGETYRCPNAECACEIEVTHGSATQSGNKEPRCCCGAEMEKVD